MPVFLWILLATLTLTACQGNPAQRVIVDTKGIDMAQYRQDLAECQALADQARPGGAAARGALGGAVIGGALGSLFGNRHSAARMAGGGAVIGGASQAGAGYSERDQVLRNCMAGRGYRVLN